MFKRNKNCKSVDLKLNFKNQLSCLFSLVIKLLELKVNTKFIEKKNLILYITKNNTYTTFNLSKVNNLFLTNSLLILKKNQKHFVKSTKTSIAYSSFFNLCYYIIFKFKLLNRFFKIKKTKNNILLKCFLMYSHKLFFINNFKYNFFKIRLKLKNNKILYYSLFNLSLDKSILFFFKKLRKRIFYTINNVKILQIPQLKRKGKVTNF